MAELYVVEFKGSRRAPFYNSYHHTLRVNDLVIAQVEQGEDIGKVARRVETNPEFSESDRPRSILRPASKEDKARFEQNRINEQLYKREVTGLVRRHGLIMKIVDAEIQHDGHKITFFFTADHRVDFRSLVRDLASRYRTRIELRQIGVRDEARRVDGYGICGQRQCCNTFIGDFAPITTSHAREQDLSLNPSKISGNCGRLLCCLRYEVDQYVVNRKKFPRPGASVETIHGIGTIDRIDYFREEAVLTNAEGVSFRAKSEEIVRVQTPSGGRDFGRRGGDSDRTDEEALKRLDEPEDLN
jgi:cell fate regulator YaaT (PSP1 superfamily)